MADTIKCACSSCGAKYRLPIEAQGRSARCKRCGERFEVPKSGNLEDTILDWLNVPDDSDDEATLQPRVINMPKEQPDGENTAATKGRLRGPIRMKSRDGAEKEKADAKK